MQRAVLALVVAGMALSATPASAQLFEISRLDQSRAVSMATDVAYDPIHDCYFVITGWPNVVTGQFLDRFGRTLGPTFTLGTPDSFFVSATVYSPDVSDGAGGRGGFLAIWVAGNGEVVAQIVSFPGRLVGVPRPIFTAHGEFRSSDVAYSPTDRTFLVALEYRKFETLFDAPSWLVRVDLSAQAIGAAALSSDPNYNCFFEYTSTCDVHVEWNPVSREFGVLYPQGISSSETSGSVNGCSRACEATALSWAARMSDSATARASSESTHTTATTSLSDPRQQRPCTALSWMATDKSLQEDECQGRWNSSPMTG
jgi:hypothetical protein